MKVCVVGVGGIGSYFAEHIDKLITLGQLKDEFHFYDDDKVEHKNMLYQNFEPEDIDSPKTEALSVKFFNVQYHETRVTEKDLECFDLIILCADNNKIRREAWNNWEKKGIPFIDSRANGKAVGIFSSDTENYIKTLGASDKSSSCQNPFQIAKEEIEYGNVVVAAILAQTVLSYRRTSKLPADIMITL